MTFINILTQLESVLLWGFATTAVMTTVLYGSQGLGLSRLSLPFLIGTCVTGNRDWAILLGFIIYTIGGWLFAFLYFMIFSQLGFATGWLGATIGLAHGLFLLTVVLPVLPHIHPRMASEYDGPTAIRRLEPPGFLGLNYGYRTPLTTLLGHASYGAILGVGYSISYMSH
jgi:hypothetical protein